ncbi:MAG: TonB family protein [Bryobacterales bacterium]|nr:TonB family protein [Bryobacterales bacterium]
MFDQTFVDSPTRTHSPWSMAASLTVQTGVVGLLLLIPLLHPEGPFMKIEAPPLIYRPNVLVVEPVRVETLRRVAATAPSVFRMPITVPQFIPRGVAQINDAPDLAGPSGFVGSIPGGINVDGFIGGLTARVPASPPKPAPRVETPAPPTAPLRVSTSVQSALLKFGPKPSYPPLAKAARVQGTVRLTAIVGTDGTIRNLRLISGPPLLVQAALQTVATWRYQPTLLNGVPVDVVTEVDVNFTLSQ